LYIKKERKMIGHLTKFDQIIDKVLKHEGGYVNDPNDPGGETNYGISKRAYPDVDIKNSNKIDVDGFIGPNTIKALSNIENERVRSYRIMYYSDLITKKPTLEKYWFGWYRRASEV
jgi:lysozyme family protein